MRELSLASHMRAVEISRQLTTANPSDYLLRFALALALEKIRKGCAATR
jgi:hypothetical protein